jgi:phage FluMu protein Com
VASTGAEQCPHCGEVNEFGLPSEDSTVKEVTNSKKVGTDKKIRRKECGGDINIAFH